MAGIKHEKLSAGTQISKQPAKNNYNDEDDGEPELPDTVFIRNLATFDTTQELLKEYIEKNFGETVYCLICKNKETGMSKGTAFVKFKSPEMAQKCLDEFEDPEFQTKFFLDGRNIFVLPALTRDRISEVKKAKASDIETEALPKKKKKPRHNRPQTQISAGAQDSNVSATPVKKQSKHHKSHGNNKGSMPSKKDNQKKGNKHYSRPSKDGGSKPALGKKVEKNLSKKRKVEKNLSKKKKAIGKKISHMSRGRH